jgi:5-methyltetrahydrofolate--homocysteine methyltransferase
LSAAKNIIMSKIIDEIKSGRVLVSDGAWGTFLQQKGLQPGECPEEWNLSRPNDVQAIAQSYIDAGADMVETNSFGGNYFKLKNYGLEDQIFEINRTAAEISRKAAGTERFVLGSVGPTGKLLMMEEETEDELYDVFKQQSIALEAGGSDAIVIETMTDLEEARIAVKAAKENTGCAVFCTMTFDKTVTGEYRTMMGISPAEMVDALVEAGADVIGANCGNGIANMIEIVKEIRLVNATVPVLIHANAGIPHYCDGITTFPETPADMAGRVKEIVDAGANIIGGCCGTTPDHICQVHRVVKSL